MEMLLSGSSVQKAPTHRVTAGLNPYSHPQDCHRFHPAHPLLDKPHTPVYIPSRHGRGGFTHCHISTFREGWTFLRAF